MCLPKIYMNASQDEEVKDGARSEVRSAMGHAETKPRWRFLLAGRIMKKARIDMEVR